MIRACSDRYTNAKSDWTSAQTERFTISLSSMVGAVAAADALSLCSRQTNPGLISASWLTIQCVKEFLHPWIALGRDQACDIDLRQLP